ncbi:ribonuclease HII [Carnobacterium divergens]|uniref:Ribonuclease HII n=1 Tax=Carnobacterium divergens TaxID=2748 RepID=A0AAW8RH99_CARDV|nr:ribonuclease HII [Carnobacterium divergens]MDT1959143.1 ribonuclease HII [Carnobacterium divergens]MDT1975031.1 ribonuclease HII [Carnobacterium divergens]TFJ38604.1 ribonuclease HII [Carnobacterium divergens]TFJ47838.1 ribonuclease HII [Carnobacterium divergens]TFJ52802.1 ribonuclease HII [Carnobacterium divergens]
MDKKLTILEVKELLKTINTTNDPLFERLTNDERKGVQIAIKAWHKKQADALKLEEKHQEMLQFEEELWQKNCLHIAGIDEVGRGPLAGPVVAAAVILPKNFHVLEINDSKQLSEAKRDALFEKIKDEALAIGVGIKDESTIDQVNIYQATKLAMIEAVENLTIDPQHLLIDAMQLDLPIPQTSIIKGDARSLSIAAASIVAKVTRDRMMKDYDEQYPGYGFDKNAGYGTKVHLEGLEKYGVTPIHRKTFAPVKNQLLKER